MIRLAIAGATGRTGRRVLDLSEKDTRFEVTAALTKPGAAKTEPTIRCGDRDLSVVETLDVPCDVLLDFSTPDGTMAWLSVCGERRIPMVIGATGHSDEQRARIRKTASVIPIVMAGNFSMGIQALLRLVGPLAKQLGETYDVEIIEAHHRHKVDAPSGTALALAETIAAATGRSRGDIVFGREGHTGERPKGQIGIHAVRMGEIVGSHEVHFSGPGETITLRHTAHSRDTFAAGALRAAAWIAGRAPGFHTMDDVMT